MGCELTCNACGLKYTGIASIPDKFEIRSAETVACSAICEWEIFGEHTLAYMPELKELDLQMCDISKDNFIALKIRSHCPKLQKLNLERNRNLLSSADDSTQLGETLPHQLTSLNLGDCRITQEMLAALNLGSCCPKLQCLSIGNNRDLLSS